MVGEQKSRQAGWLPRLKANRDYMSQACEFVSISRRHNSRIADPAGLPKQILLPADSYRAAIKGQLLLSVASRYCPAMKKTQIQKAASALSKLGNKAKWAKNNTPEKRRACTAAATKARVLRAKMKKEKDS